MIKRLLWVLFLGLAPVSGGAQVVAPHAIDIPPWFTETFLNFSEDIRDAARDGKRVMLYFGQDGCPYCTQLMATNFTQRSIVEKTRKNFVAIALNIWGDREVTWLDGRTMPEKDLARLLKVQFTPTLLFFDEKGRVVARLNGYYPPGRFEAALDYVALHLEQSQSLTGYLSKNLRQSGDARMHDEPFFMAAPHDLRRTGKTKPLAVVFETAYCTECDELHRKGFKNTKVLELLRGFDVVRLGVGARTALITPDGKEVTAAQWIRDLNLAYVPSFVFFDGRGDEIFRVEAYMRPFHLASSLEYVSSGAYKTQPSFQRFVQARADAMRTRGGQVRIWD